ncbi:MAG: ParB/RepB/Spo0J family partition protein [Candidatus Weimeria sp.]
MAAKKRPPVHLESLNELLGVPDVVEGQTEIRIDMIDPFKNHPFKVLDNDDMNDLVDSIKQNGVLVPVTVRTNPDDDSRYEMISGHRRMHAATLAGLRTIPAIIKEMSDDEATIAMVDSNMQREEILPSERAYSLKMKMDALIRQGKRSDLTCGLEVHKLEDAQEKKTREKIGKEVGMGGRQVQRYLRLTELIPELLKLVDEKRLAIFLAVDISYFSKEVQQWIYEYCTENGMVRQSQIDALKARGTDNLDQHQLIFTLNNALPQKKEFGKLTLSKGKLDQFFPKTVTNDQREEIILGLLEKWSEEQHAKGNF